MKQAKKENQTHRKLDDIAVYIGSGISRPFVNENIGVPVLRSNNVFDGKVINTNLKYWFSEDPRGADLSKVKPCENDILVNFVNGSRKELGKAGLFKGIPKDCIVSTNFFIVRLDRNQANPNYINFFFQSEPYRKWLYQIAFFSGQGSFNQQEFKKINIPTPSLPEQEKIAEVLGCWDLGIERLEKLIDAKRKMKKGLMQKLLTGKKRFKEFKGQEWKYYKASELFGSFSKKNNDGEELLSATQDRGVIPRRLLEGKVMSPEGSLKGYKLVEPGDFIISLRSFQGGLEYSEYRGLISPAYTVLKPSKEIDNLFYKHYFKSYDFIGHLAVTVIGIRDGKQISYGDFAILKLPYPPIEEQQKIASVLNAADREIELLCDKLDALKNQKKGLMQKLLTGKIRVKA